MIKIGLAGSSPASLPKNTTMKHKEQIRKVLWVEYEQYCEGRYEPMSYVEWLEEKLYHLKYAAHQNKRRYS